MPPLLTQPQPPAAAQQANPFTVPAARAVTPEASPLWATAVAAPTTAAAMPPPGFAPQPLAQRVAVESIARRNLDGLPDFMDGRARSRRMAFILLAVAILALLGAFGAAIASNYRPM